MALAPSVITIYIILELFFTFDGWLSGLYSRVPWLTIDGEPIPGLGIVSLLILIIATGIVAKNFLGGQLFRIAEAGVLKVPMVRGIYNTIKQLGQAFFGNQRAIFHEAVIIPFPMPGMYAVAFVTADAAPEIQEKTAGDMVSVFVPTTPNPTSGYMLMVEREKMIPLEMSIEDALRLVISGGAVKPPEDFPASAETVAVPDPAGSVRHEEHQGRAEE